MRGRVEVVTLFFFFFEQKETGFRKPGGGLGTAGETCCRN